jgi:hypothetical protein
MDCRDEEVTLLPIRPPFLSAMGSENRKKPGFHAEFLVHPHLARSAGTNMPRNAIGSRASIFLLELLAGYG